MKRLTILPLLFFSLALFSQSQTDSTLRTNTTKIENIENNVDKANSEIETIRRELDSQRNLYNQLMSSISNQLSVATYALGIFGVGITIIGIILGVYVTNIAKRVEDMGDQSKQLFTQSKETSDKIKDTLTESNRLLTENQKIKEEIENFVKGHGKELYSRLKREETVSILNRLIEVPDDISNVSASLLSRKLILEDYKKLREAYLLTTDRLRKAHYQILFFQHFLDAALKDNKLKADIIENIPMTISLSFKNDILKSVKEFASILVEAGVINHKEALNQYFTGLGGSQFINYFEAYQVFFEALKTRKLRFEVFDSIDLDINEAGDIDKKGSKVVPKMNFGNELLIYSTQNPTHTESLSFEELEKIKQLFK